MGVVECVKNILKTEGIRGFYRSYLVTVTMNAPYFTTLVCVNENLKTFVQPWNRKHPLFWYFICAGCAGGVQLLLLIHLMSLKHDCKLKKLLLHAKNLENSLLKSIWNIYKS